MSRDVVDARATEPTGKRVPSEAAPATGRRRRSRVTWSTRRSVALMAPAGAFLVVFCVYPLEELVRMSLSEVQSAQLLDRQWRFVGLDNFRETVLDRDFAQAVTNTLLLMVVVVSITLVGGVASAFVLQRRTRVNQGIQALMVFLWALPPLVSASIWKFLLSGDGLLPMLLVRLGVADSPPTPLADAGWALLVVAVAISWTGVAFASLTMRAGLLGLDRYQVEAAALDGASRRQIARYVVLPALRPAILVQALLAMIYAFRIFDYPFVMTSGGPGTASTTLPYLAYKQSFAQLSFGTGAATAVISVAFVLGFAMIYLWLIREESE